MIEVSTVDFNGWLPFIKCRYDINACLFKAQGHATASCE